MAAKAGRFAEWAKLTETLSVLAGVVVSVVGVVISVESFNEARKQEAYARQKESDTRNLELQKYNDRERRDAAAGDGVLEPFLELRQKRYMETVTAAAVLANPKEHTEEEKTAARKRFKDLYVAELTMVESKDVEDAMTKFGRAIDPELENFSPVQDEAYSLAHTLRDSLVKAWGVKESYVDNPNR